MPYKTGTWGPQAQARAKRRAAYHRERSKRVYHGLKLPENRTLGYQGELEAMKLLPGAVRVNRLHDLEWEGKKVEVKTAMRSAQNDRWFFSVMQQRGKVDYFVFICKDRRKRTVAVFMIPDDNLTQRVGVAISPGSMTGRYNPYLIRKRGD